MSFLLIDFGEIVFLHKLIDFVPGDEEFGANLLLGGAGSEVVVFPWTEGPLG